MSTQLSVASLRAGGGVPPNRLKSKFNKEIGRGFAPQNQGKTRARGKEAKTASKIRAARQLINRDLKGTRPAGDQNPPIDRSRNARYKFMSSPVDYARGTQFIRLRERSAGRTPAKYSETGSGKRQISKTQTQYKRQRQIK